MDDERDRDDDKDRVPDESPLTDLVHGAHESLYYARRSRMGTKQHPDPPLRWIPRRQRIPASIRNDLAPMGAVQLKRDPDESESESEPERK
jgi:hypothetical protein